MHHPIMVALRTDRSRAFGLVVLRLVYGTIFIYHGWPKLMDPAKTAMFFAKIGIPAPAFFGPFVGAVETFGGALIILGLMTRFWGAGLAIDMTVAILAAKGLSSFGKYEFELLLLAVSLAFFFKGPGSWSVDAVLMRRAAREHAAAMPMKR